ncbi:MAG: hypothetical protein ACK5UE_06250 [Chitinophagales bacterium]|jgi:hypothetical protein|nr:hypothetical protein [Sphingobacteriales bacterium]
MSNIDITLGNCISIYSKNLRKSDTKYIKPRGLPAIEDPEQSYKLKHFKKLTIFGYSIVGGKLDLICDRLDACMIKIAKNFANIHSVGISISDQLGIKFKKLSSKNGYYSYSWKLKEGFMYLGNTKDGKISILVTKSDII